MKKFIFAVLLMAALTGLTACQSKSEKVNLADVYEAVKTVYGENFIPNMDYDEQMLADIFSINKELYDSYIAQGPMISVHVDHFVAVEAKSGKGEEVEKLLKAYRETMVKDSVQYPMNIATIQSSEVLRYGDYVFFVMLGTPTDESQEKGEDAALESAKESNKKAIDVINGFFKS